MKTVSPEEVQEFILGFLRQKMQVRERDWRPPDFSEQYDLLFSGWVDSFGILELLMALNNYCGKEIDFEPLDIEQLTIVGPLCRFVAEQSTTTPRLETQATTAA